MSELSQKLKARLAFDGEVNKFNAAYMEHKRTEPLVTLLIEAVEALEDVLPYYNPKELGYMSAHGIYNNAEEVLSRLRKELGE